MATPPKKTPPELNPNDVTELKAGVVALAERVTQLADALKTVNQVQARMTETEATVKQIEKDASSAQKKTTVLEETMIPRDEHEKIWKAEQQKLIDTRLSIRRQTYVLFVVSMTALGIVAYLVFHDLAVQDKQRHDQAVARCEQGNKFRQDDRALWEEVLTLSASQRKKPLTSAEQETQKQFEAFLDEHDALTDCSKVE